MTNTGVLKTRLKICIPLIADTGINNAHALNDYYEGSEWGRQTYF